MPHKQVIRPNPYAPIHPLPRVSSLSATACSRPTNLGRAHSIKDIHSCAIVVILYTIVVILNIHIYQIVINLDTIHQPPCRVERPRHIRIASINKVLFDRVLIDDSLSIEKGSKYFMHRHLISHLIRQVNSRKSATAGTLHLRRPLMTNRGGLLLPQPREG